MAGELRFVPVFLANRDSPKALVAIKGRKELDVANGIDKLPIRGKKYETFKDMAFKRR